MTEIRATAWEMTLFGIAIGLMYLIATPMHRPGSYELLLFALIAMGTGKALFSVHRVLITFRNELLRLREEQKEVRFSGISWLWNESGGLLSE